MRCALVVGVCGAFALQSEAGTQCSSIYRLTEKASYQEGCYPPCYCPLMMASGIRGTFVVGPGTANGEFIDHEVLNAYWIVTLGDTEFAITGAGTYRVSIGPLPIVHALDLELSVDGAETQHFFSGFQPKMVFDDSIDIPISINGEQCYDTVIVVAASPVAPESILHYKLAEGSTYQSGCFDPCDCPLEEERGAQGSMLLVPILDHGTWVEYAVPRAEFLVAPPDDMGEAIGLSGFGSYMLAQGFAGPAHILDLELRAGDGEPERFKNTLSNTAPTFPAGFDVVINVNDRVCFDQVLSIHALWSGPVIFQDDFECGNLGSWSSIP